MKLSAPYADLPELFYQQTRPLPVAEPKLLLFNEELAAELRFDEALVGDPEALARVFSGNELLPGSEPLALAYAGHQFGHFVPQLGDGRAHLLGALTDRRGRARDLQLKGSGRTAFSRGGDGRCALKPAIREYVMGEALHALGVPTSRSLAVVTTGEPVYREGALPGAVVTRVAASHLRVGTFQYAAARQDLEALQALCDHAAARHFPELFDEPSPAERAVALLERVIAGQVRLVVAWMRVGFIHGVMNTDNTAISGETIDYGPCAMISAYDPGTVFSSIDHGGRYAFGNQPMIASWNLARLADCLVPLVDPDPKAAVERLNGVLEGVGDRFQGAWLAMMRRKLGLSQARDEDEGLVRDLLRRMEKGRLDYTVLFHGLGHALSSEEARAEAERDLGEWYGRWQRRLQAERAEPAQAEAIMQRTNPAVIPRNHHVETVLEACQEALDPTPAERFLEVLRAPYEELPRTADYQDPPADNDRCYQTFCGT